MEPATVPKRQSKNIIHMDISENHIVNKVFTVKRNLVRHTKAHNDNKLSCNVCSKVFARKEHLTNHTKKIHNNNVNLPVKQQNTDLEVSTNNSKTKNSSVDNNSNIFKHMMLTEKNHSYNDIFDSRKRENENSACAIKLKKARMELVKTPGFIEIASSHHRKAVWYYAKNINNLCSYRAFFNSIKNDLIKILHKSTIVRPIKYKHRVGENYSMHESRYDFSGLTFPTPINEIKIFEKNNPNVSVNVYGLKKEKQNNTVKNTLYPLKVVDEEKKYHFDLLLIDDKKNTHYTYISNFSRLACSQMSSREHTIYICKSCFTTFNDRPKKFKLHGQAALEEHVKICGAHKPIQPVLPEEGEILQFEAWSKAQKHPIVIYADFEALLIKCTENKGENTRIIQKHNPMSYVVCTCAFTAGVNVNLVVFKNIFYTIFDNYILSIL